MITFGLIGSEDISKTKIEKKEVGSWFLNLCKDLSQIHTGDISNYISWITGTLAATVVLLMGILYIDSFVTIIILTSIFIAIFITIAIFIK